MGSRAATRVVLASTAVVAVSLPAAAQTLVLPRADVSATLSWLTVNKEPAGGFDSYDDWNSSLFGAIGAGWHWTENHKTEIDFGAGTEARAYLVQSVVINARPVYVSSESSFHRRTLGVSQQYQFFNNAWFHPHVAVGANISWERITDRFNPIVVYDEVNRTGRVIEGSRLAGPRTEVRTRPFVGVGYKAYLSRRGFFRNDLRIAFRDGVDDVMVRAGFGFDF